MLFDEVPMMDLGIPLLGKVKKKKKTSVYQKKNEEEEESLQGQSVGQCTTLLLLLHFFFLSLPFIFQVLDFYVKYIFDIYTKLYTSNA